MWDDSSGAFAFWIMVAVATVGFWYAMTPVLKALAQRIAGKASSPQLTDMEARIVQLEQRGLTSGEVENQFMRLAEVEERLDFTERMLADRLAVRPLGSVEPGSHQ
jgi:hypothetical protein